VVIIPIKASFLTVFKSRSLKDDKAYHLFEEWSKYYFSTQIQVKAIILLTENDLPPVIMDY